MQPLSSATEAPCKQITFNVKQNMFNEKKLTGKKIRNKKLLSELKKKGKLNLKKYKIKNKNK